MRGLVTTDVFPKRLWMGTKCFWAATCNHGTRSDDSSFLVKAMTKMDTTGPPPALRLGAAAPDEQMALSGAQWVGRGRVKQSQSLGGNPVKLVVVCMEESHALRRLP